jgi:hypothetical protein
MDKGKGKGFWAERWPTAAGVFCAACWAVAATWGQGEPFALGTFLLRAAAYSLFGFLFFALGLAPANVARDQKDWIGRISVLIGGIALNAGLIYFFFFR